LRLSLACIVSTFDQGRFVGDRSDSSGSTRQAIGRRGEIPLATSALRGTIGQSVRLEHKTRVRLYRTIYSVVSLLSAYDCTRAWMGRTSDEAAERVTE
jgi:hypothetical protein